MHYYPLELEVLSPFFKSGKSCILLDTAQAGTQNRYSYLFYDPLKTIYTFHYSELEKILLDIDDYAKQYWLCGYLAYEAGYALEPKFSVFQSEEQPRLPLLWFGLFKQPMIFDHFSGKWDQDGLFNSGFSSEVSESVEIMKPKVNHTLKSTEFIKIINIIKNEIKKGETYQVNFTYDVALEAFSEPFTLYKYLRKNQSTSYCAFMQNEFGYVASFSPELFFRLKKRKITTKPMKGTAPRGFSINEDKKIISWLRNSIKNQAENLMIVDLLRNDLGRICNSGTVITKKLFEVESHPTIHQMTSTINGVLKPEIKFSDIIRNIFPCGSVTGAPKIRTMQIIHDLETGHRGVYCGTLGYIAPQGDAVFSVPIRTLSKDRLSSTWNYRVGSGIIWDSKAEEEWLECAHKCRFLEQEIPDFDIIETLLLKKRFRYQSDHIRRMKSSAHYFGFPFSQMSLEKTLIRIKQQLNPENSYLVRISLNKYGEFHWSEKLLSVAAPNSNILYLSSSPVNSRNIFLYHKTSYRPWFKEAMGFIGDNKCFDVLFFNTKREITEGARSTIFIEKKGVLYTPPISCGLLPGILRKNLLRRKKCQEKILSIDDLKSANKVYCGNSVRGMVQVFPQKIP